MKSALFDASGNKKGNIELPKIFDSKIREDIVLKYFEADKLIQPYSPMARAGLRQSATGTISHKRHDWKGHYGKGISRMPRKTMWRRGTQFFWIGANVPATRGGRKAHPPKGIGVEKKINRKEITLAMSSGFAATASQSLVSRRYATIGKFDSMPVIIEALPQKTKSLVATLKNIFGEKLSLVLKQKSVRAGKGKLRGRKYKSNAGALLIVSSKEKTRFKGIDVKTPSEVKISDLYPLGRLAIYTQNALSELEVRK